MEKRRHLIDVIVISSIIFVSVIALILVFVLRKGGSYAAVEVNGEVVGEYSLSQNGTFVLNGGTNTLVIENGSAYLINSSCPDHTCEKTGKLRFVGQSAICLPNKLSVTIRGEKQEGGVDLVS